MPYYSQSELKSMGFKKLGRDVLLSTKASVYDAEKIELGDYCRIDDYCVVSGNVSIGKYCHITPMCLVAGGNPGVYFSDFCTLAYGVRVFAQSDDYSGNSLTNSLIPKKYKNEEMKPVFLRRHVIVGTSAVVMPGVDVAEGCAIGALTLVNRSTRPWGIYVGSPARRLKDRKQTVIDLEIQFLSESDDDPI